MGDSLREYFAAIRADDLAIHGLESMALCAAIHMAAQRAGGNKDGDVRGLLTAWATRAQHDRPVAEMRRMQPVLEELLAEIGRGGIEALSPDEASLLFTASALLKMLPATPYYESVRERLEPCKDRLGQFVAGNPPSPLLANLSERWVLICANELAWQPTREVRKISGIPVEFQGVVYTVPARTKLIGSLPEQTMLVVEDGACCIEGFVEGVAAVSGDCVVQENIGGIVISGEGDIHARKLIDRSKVIAKLGSVHCREAASPELVFGGRRILVEGDATRGVYRAHEVEIRGRALGCTIAVSGRAEAARFAYSDRFDTAVILRREFDSADYGEEIGLQARRTLSEAARIKQRMRTVHELIGALTGEVEQDAHTVLVCLAIGEDAMGRVGGLERDQRRLATLNRVIMGLHQLNSEAEENVYAAAWERHGEEVAATGNDSLEAIMAELQGLEASGGDAPRANEPEVEQFKEIHSQMGDIRANRLAVVTLLDTSRTRLRHWVAERDALRQRIQQVHRDLEHALKVLEGADEGGTGAKSIDRLRTVMANKQFLTKNRQVKMRANSRFVHLMRRNINARLDRLRELRLESKKLRADFERIQKELQSKIRLRLEEEDSEPSPLVVTGRFDAGVRLCTNELALETDDAPDTILLTLAKAREEVTSFARTDTGLEEVG